MSLVRHTLFLNYSPCKIISKYLKILFTFLSAFSALVFTSLSLGFLGSIVGRVRVRGCVVSSSGVRRSRCVRGSSVDGGSRVRRSRIGRSGISRIGRSGIRCNSIGAGSIRIVAGSGVTISIVVAVIVRIWHIF